MQTRTLPHDLNAEKSVLGALLINPAQLERVVGRIAPEDFFRDGHRRIFAAAMRVAYDQRIPVDLLTLRSELERTGDLEDAGGVAYITALTDGVPVSANATHYAAIVRDLATRRALIRAANETLAGAYDGEETTAELINQADRAIVELQRGAGGGRLVYLEQSAAELYEDLEHRVAHAGELSGVETGFQSVNEMTLGWQRGDMIVIAARPSMGKTAFILNTALAAARTGARVVIFSLEMRRRQLEHRLLASLAGVQLTQIRAGYLGEQDFARLSEAMTELATLPIAIDDRGGQTVWDIRATCRRMRAEHGLDLVIVDYFQLVRGTLEARVTRNEQLTDVSRRLKTLADEVNVPLLLCSQLSRAGDVRSDKRPILSDLRETGALEQDADIVAFLHRKHHRESGKTSFIFEKQRNGPTGTVHLELIRETQTFADAGPAAELPLDQADEDPKPPDGFTGRRRRSRK